MHKQNTIIIGDFYFFQPTVFAQPGCGKIRFCVFYLLQSNHDVICLRKLFALGPTSRNQKKFLVARRHLAMIPSGWLSADLAMCCFDRKFSHNAPSRKLFDWYSSISLPLWFLRGLKSFILIVWYVRLMKFAKTTRVAYIMN